MFFKYPFYSKLGPHLLSHVYFDSPCYAAYCNLSSLLAQMMITLELKQYHLQFNLLYKAWLKLMLYCMCMSYMHAFQTFEVMSIWMTYSIKQITLECSDVFHKWKWYSTWTFENYEPLNFYMVQDIDIPHEQITATEHKTISI